MEPSTFDWKEAMALFLQGIEIEGRDRYSERDSWTRHNPLRGEAHFYESGVYRRAPVEVKEEDLKQINENLTHINGSQRRLIASYVEDIDSLKEQLRVKEEHWNLELEIGNELRAEQAHNLNEITSLHDSLNEERGKVEKAKDLFRTCRQHLKLGGGSNHLLYNIELFLTDRVSETNLTSGLPEKDRAVSGCSAPDTSEKMRIYSGAFKPDSVSYAKESGEKKLNSKEELSSSLHDAPSGEVRIDGWCDLNSGKYYKTVAEAPHGAHLSPSPLKQEESEPSEQTSIKFVMAWRDKRNGKIYLNRMESPVRADMERVCISDSPIGFETFERRHFHDQETIRVLKAQLAAVRAEASK